MNPSFWNAKRVFLTGHNRVQGRLAYDKADVRKLTFAQIERYLALPPLE